MPANRPQTAKGEKGRRGIHAPEIPAEKQSGFSRGPFARQKPKSRIAHNYPEEAHNKKARNPGQSMLSGEEKCAKTPQKGPKSSIPAHSELS